MKIVSVGFAILFATLAFGQPPKLPRPCSSLAALSLPETTIISAASIPAGSFTPPGWRDKADLPAFCRVVGRIRPAVKFEVWVPDSRWNGRFVGAGNGGFGGSIN